MTGLIDGQTASERFAAMEFLRLQYPGYEDQLSKGLLRVCNIVGKHQVEYLRCGRWLRRWLLGPYPVYRRFDIWLKPTEDML